MSTEQDLHAESPDRTSERPPTSRRVDLEEITELATPIVSSIVWATATTVGPDHRPRSRIVHPVMRWSDPPLGWITSRPTSLKRRHLAAHPFVTLSYWSPAQDGVTLDCDAAWLPEQDRPDVWRRISEVPAPVGFDPATIWPDGPTSPDHAVIVVRPIRIRVVTAALLAQGAPQPLWSAVDEA